MGPLFGHSNCAIKQYQLQIITMIHTHTHTAIYTHTPAKVALKNGQQIFKLCMRPKAKQKTQENETENQSEMEMEIAATFLAWPTH